MRRREIHFESTMTKTEKILGWCYFPVHVAVLPLLLGVYQQVSTHTVSDVMINVVYYGIGIAYVLALMWRYLRRDFDVLADGRLRGLMSVFPVYLIDTLLSYFAMALIMYLESEIINPNNEQIVSMLDVSPGAMFGMAVVMGPVVEELLFRGVVFGSIRPKSRLWAYVISIVLFSLYHVWQYAFMYQDAGLLIYAIQYVPTAFALAWCYERTGSIWVPMFYHGMVNALSITYFGA